MPSHDTLRRRKNSKRAKLTKGDEETKSFKSEKTIIEVGLPEEETLSQTFFRHPLVRVSPIILLPYVIYQIIYFLALKHPEWITNGTFHLVSLRPSLSTEDFRQVLIIGSEIPENRFVAQGLAASLGLEIVHETFDPTRYFCRDGSTSWFQFMRFVEPLVETSRNRDAPFAAWKELCLNRNHTMVQVFHPKDYGPSNCSSYDSWSPCWAQECFSIVKSLWACELDDSRDCPQRFKRILHQVRHPIHTIQTLNATICPNLKLTASFLNVIGGFFPDRDWREMSCFHAMAWYTVDFHRSLIQARDAGYIHGMFRIENTSPCEVATMAGFGDEASALHFSNPEKITRICRDDEGNMGALSHDTFTRVKKENKMDGKPGSNQITLKHIDDPILEKEIERLVSALGYDNDGDLEFA